MTESILDTDQEKALSEAVNEVMGLYMGDQMEALLGPFQGGETRDSLWAETTQKFPVYAGKIMELRQAVQAAIADKKAYPPQLIGVMGLSFATLSDAMARECLRDILFSRITKRPGYLDYDIDAIKEALVMADEMGLQGGWRSEEAKEVAFENVIGAVLTGKLRVSYQPKS